MRTRTPAEEKSRLTHPIMGASLFWSSESMTALCLNSVISVQAHECWQLAAESSGRRRSECRGEGIWRICPISYQPVRNGPSRVRCEHSSEVGSTGGATGNPLEKAGSSFEAFPADCTYVLRCKSLTCSQH